MLTLFIINIILLLLLCFFIIIIIIIIYNLKYNVYVFNTILFLIPTYGFLYAYEQYFLFFSPFSILEGGSTGAKSTPLDNVVLK